MLAGQQHGAGGLRALVVGGPVAPLPQPLGLLPPALPVAIGAGPPQPGGPERAGRATAHRLPPPRRARTAPLRSAPLRPAGMGGAQWTPGSNARPLRQREEEQREALLSARSDGRVPGWGLGKQQGSQPPPPGAKRFVKSELKNTVILQTEPQIQVPIVLKKPLQRT